MLPCLAWGDAETICALKDQIQVVKEWVAGKFCRQRDKGAGYGVNPGTLHVLYGFPMTRARTRWQRLPEPSALCGMSLAAAEMEIPPPTGPVVKVRSNFQWWEHFAC